jgi:hypothetical protein
MQKNNSSAKKRESKKATLVEMTAEVSGVSKRSVQRVINGTQENDFVFDTYMNIKEGVEKVLVENKLLAAVEKLVPFNK